MKLLVTGSSGFVGSNLVASLESIRDNKDRVRKIRGLVNPSELEIIKFDKDNTLEELESACKDCDFVFNLAGVNRPKKQSEFMEGNWGFASDLINTLKKYNNKCPVMLASSIQATLIGRYEESDYGKSKLAGERLFFEYSRQTGARVLVYRFPNLFGKWCRPNYNSVVATFCNNIANGLPIQVNDRLTELELLYIDDLVDEMIRALNGEEHRCEFDGVNAVADRAGSFCYVPNTHKATLGEIVDLLNGFNNQDEVFYISDIPNDSFVKKLYSTYLSYLPAEKCIIPLRTNADYRGSFTEIIKSEKSGQFSINISNPGVTKGEHWHHTKWELFVVVSGHGLIQQRKIGTEEIIEFEVSGDNMQAVYMLPGYTHNLINLSETDKLITFMWANEQFDPNHPDTFGERVNYEEK